MTITKCEVHVDVLMPDDMDERLQSKLMGDDTDGMELEFDDRVGKLSHAQQAEADDQASLIGVPKAFTPPWLPLPNGFNFGDGTATGTGQDAADAWMTSRV